MKIKLLVDIVFEYGGIRKTKFKAGTVFNATPAYKWFIDPGTKRPVETKDLDGYWIGDERMPPVPGLENSGTLIRTKCFVNECVVVD